MNKILSTVAIIVALVTTLSFAKEGFGVGIRAGFNLNDFTGDNTDGNMYDMSFGSGGGILANIPLADFLSLNPEISFYYRRPMAKTEKNEATRENSYYYLDELALSIPVMLRFAPDGVMPFYLAAGVQLDIPFSAKEHIEVKSYEGKKVMSDSRKVKKRAKTDFGIALGLGYNITPNFGFDLRCIVGLTNFIDYPVDEDEPDISFNQYGIGIAYIF